MKSIAVLLAAMCLGLILNDAASAAETADLVISGGTIYSGGDEAPFAGDVAVIPGDTEHEGFFPEDTEVVDIFAPPREDFLAGGTPAYMRAP